MHEKFGESAVCDYFPWLLGMGPKPISYTPLVDLSLVDEPGSRYIVGLIRDTSGMTRDVRFAVESAIPHEIGGIPLDESRLYDEQE